MIVNVQSLELLATPQGDNGYSQAPQRPQAPQAQSYGQSAPQYPPRVQAPVQRDMYDEPIPGPESFNDDIPF